MKIGIDARFYSQSGVGRYIRNLIGRLKKKDYENEYFIFLSEEDFGSFKENENFHKVRADFKWYGFAEQINFPPLLYKYNLDLVHFPHFNIPIFYKKKFIVTIHDLIHQNFKTQRATTRGALIYKLKSLAYNYAFYASVVKSQQVITVSNFVKNQIEKKCSINKAKITVTYEAVEENIINISKTIAFKKIDQILKKYNVKRPFIFYVGNAHPHKNVEGLIKAFLKLRKNYQYLQLVLAGNDHYFWRRIKKEYEQKDIVYTGFINDEELVAFYKSASVYVLPSFEEGFGIPLLEAMACGCPVVSSNAGSLPEVGCDAALYFDPKDIEDMSEKITQLLNNQKLRKELIEKGLRHYKQFSWESLAMKTLEVYQKA